jgi:hypothetical protein
MSQESPSQEGSPQLPPFRNGLFNGEVAPARAQRDRRGRFALGNKGGPGNPDMRRVALLRQAALAALAPETVRDILAAMVVRALTGDLGAAKLVLNYAVGKADVVAEADGDDPGAFD